MPNWTEPMSQSFEYFIVDPATWLDQKLLTTVKSCNIRRDSSAETLGSADFDIDGQIGECYIRVYLVVIQNGIKESYPLGTYLVLTPGYEYDGATFSSKLDAYTPLMELKESYPDIGYTVIKDTNIMKSVCELAASNMRAPVVSTSAGTTLLNNFTAGIDETWLSYLISLAANADYIFDLTEKGEVVFSESYSVDKLQPVWVFDDGNSSILTPSVSIEHDMYGMPNVIEVVYSSPDRVIRSEAVNDSARSPISVTNRGRRIVHRVTNPELSGIASQEIIDRYARELLESVSTIGYKITYEHGYCPVRVGDCVLLRYSKLSSINDTFANIKAKVTSQSISCTPGCLVTETAEFSINMLEV